MTDDGQHPRRSSTRAERQFQTAYKLRRPAARSHWVPRPRLVGRLESLSPGSNIFVCAPAGFGKTTLLAQWDTRMGAVPFAWVNVDPDDNDPASLLGWIVTALAESIPDVPTDLTAILRQGGAAALNTVLDIVLDRLAKTSRPTVLVLNELEHCTAHDSTEVLARLFRDAPSNLCVAVATRNEMPDPPGTTADLRPWEQLDARDLAFSVSETEQVLLHVSGRPAEAGHVARLVKRTQGWPAATCLAASSGAAGGGQFAAWLDEDGETPFADYIEHEVVDSLDAEVREFAVLSSVLDQMTPKLCAAALGDPRAAEMLRDLAASNPLISESHGSINWYRYHSLLLGPLRRRLDAEYGHRVTGLHDRAAHWLEDAGLVDDALRHAALSDDTRLLTRMVGDHWSTLVVSGRNAKLQSILGQCGEHAIDDDPELALAAAWTAGLAGEVDVFRRRLPQAERLPSGHPTRSFAARRSAPAMLRLFLTYTRLSDLLDDVEASAAAEARGDTPWQATASLALGWIRYLLGKDGSLDAFLRGAKMAEGEEPLVRSELLADAAIVTCESGNRDHARRLADESLAVVRELGLEDHPHAWATFVAQALVLSKEPAAREAAIRAADHGVALAEPIVTMSPWQTTVACYHRAQVMLALGELDVATQACARADQLVARYGHDDTDFTPRLAALRARLASSPADLGKPLTDRERRVLRLLAGSMTQAEVARELGLSPNTVKTHVRSIYRKLGATSREAALAHARIRGLL